MIRGSVSEIETFGLVDGPGIRIVIFLDWCKLRCKYCHNPEMWELREMNYTPEEIVNKIVRYKSYFRNAGGVTFSGGEPLLQSEFLIQTMKLLKENDINIALDTAGVGNGRYEEILKYVDLVIFDVKHTTEVGYQAITGYHSIEESEKFIAEVNRNNKKVWVRQVIIPGVTDSIEYVKSLKEYIKRINNVEKVEFLPYHHLGKEKYQKLNMQYLYEGIPEMDVAKCNELYEAFSMLEN